MCKDPFMFSILFNAFPWTRIACRVFLVLSSSFGAPLCTRIARKVPLVFSMLFNAFPWTRIACRVALVFSMFLLCISLDTHSVSESLGAIVMAYLLLASSECMMACFLILAIIARIAFWRGLTVIGDSSSQSVAPPWPAHGPLQPLLLRRPSSLRW